VHSITQKELETRYPLPLIRGERITRLGEKDLGRQRTDVDTCRMLGEEQIGWLVSAVSSFEKMIEHVRKLNDSDCGARWIIVPATNRLSEMAFEQWFGDSDRSFASPTLWHDKLVSFCVPERLCELRTELSETSAEIAGVIVLDPQCFVHAGRSFQNGNRRIVHDRPQMIVNFRSAFSIGSWVPPFIQMTCKRAGAVATETVSRIYCLETIHCIDGTSLGCGVLPGTFNKRACELERFDAQIAC